MKQLLILLFTVLSCSVFAQDSSSVFYKNQVGIDILPIFTGITSSESSPFETTQITYRRAFSPKYYGAFRLELNGSYQSDKISLGWISDTLASDTLSITSSLSANRYNNFSFVFSKKFPYKRVNLYIGVLASIARVNGVEQTNKLVSSNPLIIETIYTKNRVIPRLGLGLELGLEIPIYKRFSVLFNIHAAMYHHVGDWNYISRNGNEASRPINRTYYDFLSLNSLMVLYKF
jgi:hypothetical protein